MVFRIQSAVALTLVTLSLALGPAVAAPESEAQQVQPPAQAQTDDKSYLPPSMQKREVAGIGNGAAGAADPNNPAAAPKPPASGQPQRPQHKHRDDFHFLPSFRSIWRY